MKNLILNFKKSLLYFSNIFIFTFKAIFKDPTNINIIFKKLSNRITNKSVSNDYLMWLEKNCKNIDDFCKNIDKELWQESNLFLRELDGLSEKVDKSIINKMGGGGCSELLYFIVRKLKLRNIVETGVSLGFSSTALLMAVEKNGFGKVYSSDFPYPGLKNSQDYIGLLVPRRLKDIWVLEVKGDKYNLPKINHMVSNIDLLHYDSDKSYNGRDFALNIFKDKINESSIIIFDDIHENTHFKDYIENNNLSGFEIFKYKNKFIGMIGDMH